MNVPLWSTDPSILMNNEYIKEVWPLDDMSYERKINAIIRLVFFLSVVGFVTTLSFKVVITGIITMIVIHVFVDIKLNPPRKNEAMPTEGFTSRSDKDFVDFTNPKNTLKGILKKDFLEGTKKNPFSNLLLTEISDNPDRKPAPPSFNPEISSSITENVKKNIQHMNPEIHNTDNQLFGDSWENFSLDQSNRNFYTTPNTKVGNDQAAFAKFLYGDMPSGKESSIDGNLQREKNNYRHTLN